VSKIVNGVREWRSTRKRWHMADFYKWQRLRLDILMDGNTPRGGQWSFDEENRRKLPLKQLPLLPALSSEEYPTTPRTGCITVF